MNYEVDVSRGSTELAVSTSSVLRRLYLACVSSGGGVDCCLWCLPCTVSWKA